MRLGKSIATLATPAAIGAFEGSTRSVSLIRIGIALVMFAEWGDRLILIRDPRPVPAFIGASALLSAGMLLVGFRSRLAAIMTAASMAAVLVIPRNGGGNGFAHHHTHLMMLATWLLALTPCGGSYSLDRWLAVRRARGAGLPIPREYGSLWALRLLSVLVSTVYLWSVFSKLTPAFLSGARLEHLYLFYYRGSEYPTSPIFHPAMMALALCTIGTQLFLGFGLWNPRARRFAVPVGVAFHAALYYTLPVSTFSALVLLLYLAFFDPDEVHRQLEEISGHPG